MPLSRIKSQMESSQLRLDSSAASTDVNDRVLLNGVDSSSTGDGYAVILEDATANADTSQMLPQRADGVLSFSEPPVELFTPVFKIFAATDQAISDATVTIIQLDSSGLSHAFGFNNTKDFPTNLDVANFLDTSNYRVKPTIGGFYQINASARCGTNVDIHDFILYLRKNEFTHAVTRLRHFGITNDDIASTALNLSDIVHFNGVDDYIDLRIYLLSEDSQNSTIVSGSTNCFISGHLIARDK